MGRTLIAPAAIPPTGSPAARTTFDRVQLLRFVAAASVVLFHAQGTARTYLADDRTLLPFLRFGDRGVDLFFVISGFIIYYTSRERERDWRLFLRRRIERVVPLYWLFTIIAFCILLVPGASRSSGPIDYYNLPRSLFFMAWTFGSGRTPLVYPGWSLEYEMLFYLVTAGMMACAPRAWRTVPLILSGLVLSGAVLGRESLAARFFTEPMLLEFLFGVLAAQLVLERQIRPVTLAAVGVALVAVAVAGTGWRVWSAGIPSAALVTGAVWLDSRARGPDRITSLLARLGDASYSTYLVHVFIVSAGCKLALRLWPSAPLDLITLVICLAVAGAAACTYLGVERPIQRFTHRRRPPPRRDALAVP